MSRQRLRPGVLEASTHSCPLCDGTGLVRTIPSAALSALRGLEEEAVRGRASELTLRCGVEVAFYVLNRKRDDIVALEEIGRGAGRERECPYVEIWGVAVALKNINNK